MGISKMLMQLSMVVAIIVIEFCSNSESSSVESLNGGCLDRCGDVEIPFPFGTGESCYLEAKYWITCNGSSAFLTGSPIIVNNISLRDGELSVMQYLTRDCYNKQGVPDIIKPFNSIWLSDFTISGTKNKFIALGCDTYATVVAYRGNRRYETGCISSCDYFDESNLRESCSGVGCCQTSIPSGLKNFTVWLSSYYNHSFVWKFNPCSYAFVVDESKFKFSSFHELRTVETLPLVLDWSIGDAPCEVAETLENYTCKGKSECVKSNSGSGYLCKCLEGYEGNPYLLDGCQDVDECKSMTNPCSNGECQNLPGSWTCTCPKGYILNTTGTGCDKDVGSDLQSNNKRALFLYIGLGMYITDLVLDFCYRINPNS
ncbi:Thrombomodulin [Trema orientale]|uniref:Thrombomodulin n=1 Tax=Trema orientale TaxID=63057 RepID=A0A2P5ENN7_TREOI|nr:Thrombomodulin [Trema orientale]